MERLCGARAPFGVCERHRGHYGAHDAGDGRPSALELRMAELTQRIRAAAWPSVLAGNLRRVAAHVVGVRP